MGPYQLIEALGLADVLDAAALAERRTGYACIHLGTLPLEIGRLLDLFGAGHPGGDGCRLCPPRTGHLGNWEAIACGRAGALDFNQVICTHDFGYPLIYCFTQTEAEKFDSCGVESTRTGDWIYLPGSLVSSGHRRELPLYTWDGTAFVRRGRDKPLFCPFVQTEEDARLVSLTEYHVGRMRRIPEFRFRLEPQTILDNEGEVQEILAVLLEEAASRPNSRRAFQDLVSHAVSTDGTVTRCELRRDGNSYWLLDQRYDGPEALTEQILNTCRAVTAPREFFAAIGNLPPVLPVMSNLLAGALSAVFATHYPDCDPSRRKAVTHPFNLHFHWGARDMAGYPPRHKGYYVEKSTTRSLRALYTSLTGHFAHIDPVCVLLIPAAIFMLCPSSAHPGDTEAVTQLLRALKTLGRDVPAIEQATAAWLKRHSDDLSAYFLQRFRYRSGFPHTGSLVGHVPPAGQSIILDGFRETTMLQACAAIGALVAAITAH